MRPRYFRLGCRGVLLLLCSATAFSQCNLAEASQRRRRGRQVLEDRRKGNREKLKIARRLHGEATMTLDWIAQRLAMGAAGYVTQCLREAKQGKQPAILRDPFQRFSRP